MFFAATSSKSKMLMASFGDLISLSSVRGAQIMGSGSRDGVSAAMAARSDAARSGLAARNCRNLRRLVTWSSISIGDPPELERAIDVFVTEPNGGLVMAPPPPILANRE